MDADFYLLLLNIVLSLRQTAPLDENLRAVLGPVLRKLQRQYHATVAIHAFVNPILKELHAMILAPGLSEQALNDELDFRHRSDAGQTQTNPTHRKDLPAYDQLDITNHLDLARILSPEGTMRLQAASGSLEWLIKELCDLNKEDISGPLEIMGSDEVILVPLSTSKYSRLGYFILWAPGETLTSIYNDVSKQDGLIVFSNTMEKLLIRLFTNFYQMTEETYLPSYFRVERKRVALLCAEIRGFDRISQILRQRHDLGRDGAAQCLRRLVNRFTEAAATIVEKYDGRVDQIWGNGLLAVFGQYSITSSEHPGSSCMEAAMAAAEIVESCNDLFESWLNEDFQARDHVEVYSEQISLYPFATIDYGDVMFDYIGSAKNQFYMAVGDHVNFVKQLASVAGRAEFGIDDYENLLRQIKTIVRTPDEQLSLPPILFTQPAFRWAVDTLQYTKKNPANWEYYHRTIRLPGRPFPYSVYEIWPENVKRQVSKPF
jgi:class 3 adenylate cyclase